MAQKPVAAQPDWVTALEAARRMGVSHSKFRAMAKENGIRVERRGAKPGIDWRSVESFILRARIPTKPANPPRTRLQTRAHSHLR